MVLWNVAAVATGMEVLTQFVSVYVNVCLCKYNICLPAIFGFGLESKQHKPNLNYRILSIVYSVLQ